MIVRATTNLCNESQQSRLTPSRVELTFIICARDPSAHGPAETNPPTAELRSDSLTMIGDVNLFLKGVPEDPEFEVEVEIMIAGEQPRRVSPPPSIELAGFPAESVRACELTLIWSDLVFAHLWIDIRAGIPSAWICNYRATAHAFLRDILQSDGASHFASFTNTVSQARGAHRRAERA